MRRSLLCGLSLLFLATLPVLAIQSPESSYQEGVLEGAQKLEATESCVYGLSAGPAARVGLTTCSDRFDTVYVVKSGGAVYLLAPKGNLEEGYCGLLLRSTIPHNVLAGQPPSTPVQLRSDGRHFFVRLGDRESEFAVARIR